MRVFRPDGASGPPGTHLISGPFSGRPRRRGWPIFALGLILVTGLLGTPAPALHGEGLVTLLGGGILLALLITLLFFDPEEGRDAGLFSLAVGAGSVLLMSVQSSGTAVLGTYAAVAGAVIRLPRRRALAVIVPIVLAVNTLIVLTASERLLVLVWTNMGYAFMFLIGHLVRLSEEHQAQAQALVDEEKQTRAARTEAAALAERGRIAREMHDVLAHSLSALAVELEGARLLARDRDADTAVVAAIERAHGHAASGLGEARAAIEALRGESTPGPDRLGELASGFARQDGIDCTFEVSGEPRPLAPEAGLAVYRTAQEALTNVRKHADAERVRMALTYSSDGTSLVVEDRGGANGNGRAPRDAVASAGGGYGVSGMRERAELIGGHLAAGPTDAGYRVELWIPT